METIVFLGDEAAAAGWRLAGVASRVPGEGAEREALAAAVAGAKVVLIAAEVAARLPEEDVRRALRALSPLAVVVPDLRETVAYPDVGARLRRQLGIEA